MASESEMTPFDLMYNIGLLSDIIKQMQDKFDSGEYKTPDKAVELQKYKNRRNELRGKLDPLELAWSHPFPDTLPKPEKRTRNEVRALMGLPPLAIDEGY